jgi:hypothetical protein
MTLNQPLDPNSKDKVAMKLFSATDLSPINKDYLIKQFPDVNPEDCNRWVMEFETTGYTAINLFSDDVLSSPEATADLAFLRKALRSSQLLRFTVLVSSFTGLSLP